MNFTNVTFLFYALPLICALYYGLRARGARNLLLLIGSLLFYAWGEGIYLGLLIGSIAANHLLVGLIAKDRSRVMWLSIGVAANLIFLIAFKYLGLVTASLMGLGVPHMALHLPLGISFFTFQAMSLLVDVKRGAAAPRSPLKTGLYISMFPQLIAGPIVRFNEISPQIDARTESWTQFRAGIFLFVLGLSQKLLLADAFAPHADAAFSAALPELSTGAAWLGLLCFSLQIFYDFAGYSNMAIGLGRMFGFEFPQNFNYPYSARSFRGFWRRWHMTLSRWFRDYLYIPLGGSRGANLATYRNLLIVFVLCGLWHGAAWTFLIWGLWHGAFLTLERVLAPRLPGVSFPPVAGWLYVWVFVALGWVFFRAESLPHALDYFQALFGLSDQSLAHKTTLPRSITLSLLIGVLLIWEGWERRVWPKVTAKYTQGIGPALLQCAALLALTGLCFAALSAQTYQAFLYFRF